LLFLAMIVHVNATLSVSFTMKETAGYPVADWPVTVVMPLPYGAYTDITTFVIRDSEGAAVPAQFTPLNRWTGRDNSIRHVAAQFLATVDSYTVPGSGISSYTFKDDGPGIFTTPLTVVQVAGEITVNTGPLKFTVNTNSFNLLDRVWLDTDEDGSFSASELIVSNTATHGAIFTDRHGQERHDAMRTNITFTLEESGPIRAVIKASSPSFFGGTNDHTNGFAVRLYAYAGQPFVKIDYQLQNAALNTDRSWPLYFEACRLDFGLTMTGTVNVAIGLGSNDVWTSNTNAIAIRQSFDSTGRVHGASGPLADTAQAEGWMTLAADGVNVTVFLRHFWEMWPGGLDYHGSGRLGIELFPEWSCQYFATNNTGAKFFTPTGLYWLEDMQATFRESLLYFAVGEPDPVHAARVAALFATPPVPVVPLDWYRETRATFDLGGYVPPGTPADTDASRNPGFIAHDWEGDLNYRLGWDNYYIDEPVRKYGTATTGGWPDSPASRFIAVGNPAYYIDAERKALAELNIRPHWLPGYEHTRDFERMRLTTAPYAGQSWRRFDGHGSSWLAAPYLDGTALDACPRDDQHGWYQQMNDWYHISANPWARDWYEFIGQFRYTSLLRTHPFEELAGRARGHALVHALAAFRATGDTNILDHFSTEVRALRADQFQHGGRHDADKAPHGPAGASWQGGYVARAVLDYMAEIGNSRDREWAEAFAFIAGIVSWNLNHANFSYYLNAAVETNVPSSSTGLTMVDVQSWYTLATGDTNTLAQTFQYLDQGINGGEVPTGKFDAWIGQYEARQWLALTNAVASGRVFSAPSPVAVFSATTGTGRITFNWEGMPGATRYHLFWSDNEISLAHTLNTNTLNWWAADTTLTNVTTTGGESLSLSVESSLSAGTPVSAVIFYIDTNSNMSVKTEIARPPVADFAGGPLRGAVPLTVNFTNQTLRQISNAQWFFGDGAATNTTHASHTYTNHGDYTVSLTVSNDAGSNTLTRTDYIHVVPEGMPIADFTWSTNRGPAPLAVQFSATSIGDIVSNRWDFGDGATSYLEDPEHTFTNAGSYAVTLVAYAIAGADTCRVVNCIESLPPPPVADFGAFPTSGGYSLTVQFTNLTSGAATNWSWSFGDGGGGGTRDPQYTYADPGVYSVALTAIGAGGSHTETKSDYITVLPEQGDDYWIAANSDDAQEHDGTMAIGEDFLYIGYSADMKAGFRFTDVQLPSSAIVSRAYIQFSSTSGRADPASAIIRAQKAADAATFSSAQGDISARSMTSASVEWEIAEWTYNGNTDAERTPDISSIIQEVITDQDWTNGAPLAFILSSTGNYGEQGMRHAWSREFAISQNQPERTARLHIEYSYDTPAEPPIADFDAFPSFGTLPLTVQFTNLTVGIATNWIWSFGDGGGAATRDPQYTYGEPGVYTVTLAANGAGGSHTETKPGYINVLTVTNFASFRLNATALDSKVMLRWTDPASCGVPGWHAMIRVDTNGYPASPEDGILVGTTTNRWLLETGVPAYQPRYYTLWLSPNAINWLAPVNSYVP
jgi:PKD repeat protein